MKNSLFFSIFHPCISYTSQSHHLPLRVFQHWCICVHVSRVIEKMRNIEIQNLKHWYSLRINRVKCKGWIKVHDTSWVKNGKINEGESSNSSVWCWFTSNACKGMHLFIILICAPNGLGKVYNFFISMIVFSCLSQTKRKCFSFWMDVSGITIKGQCIEFFDSG